jgi:hypothetical protein
VDFAALLEQEFGKVVAVLAGDASDAGTFSQCPLPKCWTTCHITRPD